MIVKNIMESNTSLHNLVINLERDQGDLKSSEDLLIKHFTKGD